MTARQASFADVFARQVSNRSLDDAGFAVHIIDPYTREAGTEAARMHCLLPVNIVDESRDIFTVAIIILP